MDFRRTVLFYFLLKSKEASIRTSASNNGRVHNLESAIADAVYARKQFEYFSSLSRWLITTKFENIAEARMLMESVRTVTVSPLNPNDKAILYIHGGAFMMGLSNGCLAFASRLANATHAKVFCPDYRLAPEHPFPAALEDVFTVYKSLLQAGYDPKKITVMGESAGGNLTLALLLLLKQENYPQPGAAIPISAGTDFRFTADSIKTRFHLDPWITPAMIPRMVFNYVRNASIENPLLSPVLGELAGLPPLLMLVGGREVVYDDTINFARKAMAAGVDVTLDVQHEMIHAYHIFYDIFDESKMALGKIALFINMKTGG